MELAINEMFQTNPLPMWVYDVQTLRFLRVNDAAVRHYGYSAEEFLAMKIADIRPPEDLAELLRKVERAGDKPFFHPSRHRKKDGALIDVEIISQPVPFPVPSQEGEAEGEARLIIAIDVTQRKQAEESQAFLASLVRSVDDSIIGTLVDGTIVSWNRAAERMWGFTAEEAVGQHITIIFPVGNKQDYLNTLGKVRALERIERFDSVRARKDGTPVNVSVILSPIFDGQGQLWGVSAIYSDITDRKRAEAELRRAKEAAEAANRAKNEFLSNMSHELRTPLNGILGMTQLLMLDSNLDAEQRENLDIVKASADSLLRVVDDILDYSRIESQKLLLEYQEFNLRSSLSAALWDLSAEAREKGLNLRSHIQAEIPCVFLGDPARLRQILANLVGNAVKFTFTGEVEVGVELLNADPGMLHFSVRDTGIGIPAEKQRMVFEAFSQADGSATRPFGGTGLGLAITSRLVELMGGTTWMESEEGVGSTFHFTARMEPVAQSVVNV